jgi:hypothetical protein
VATTKFLGQQIDNNVMWKAHIQYIMPKLRSACFAMDSYIIHENRNLKVILLRYGIIWGGNSTNSKKSFITSQKRIIRIIVATIRRASCRESFKKFGILPLVNEFLLSLLSFVVDNMKEFQTNSDIHSISTRYRYNLHVPNTNFSKYEKGVYYSGIKLFSKLPPNIKV